MSELQLDNPLWQFACEKYSKADVAECLLQLQDQAGMNINVLLYCAWLDMQRKPLNRQRLQQLFALTAPLQQVIEPLRLARVRLKPLNNGKQYQDLKSIELQLEQQQIAVLHDFSRNITAETADKHNRIDNIQHYLEYHMNSGGAEPQLSLLTALKQGVL